MTPADLAAVVLSAARSVVDERGLDGTIVPMSTRLERSRVPAAGHYASALALQLAGKAAISSCSSCELATAMSRRIVRTSGIRSVEVSGRGFLNIRLDPAVVGGYARIVVRAGRDYGRCPGEGAGQGDGNGPDSWHGHRSGLWKDRVLGEASVWGTVSAGPMSTFEELEELEELVDAAGLDAARYALVRQPVGAPYGIEVARWRRATFDNPVYRVQYAAARAAAISRNAAEFGLERGDDYDHALLVRGVEVELLKVLADFPAVVAVAVTRRQPHRLARFLEETADWYYRFHDEYRILPRGDELITDGMRARLWLNDATRTVFENGLGLLDISAPERM